MILYKYSDQTTNYLDGIRKWFPTRSLPVNITGEVLSYLGVEVEEVPDEVIPEPTLEEIKERKCAEINEAYVDALIIKQDTTDGKTYKAVPSFTNGVLSWTVEEVV